MNIIKFSANSFSSLKDIPFDPLEYSKLKYGSKTVSRRFGTELGNKFVNDLTMRSYFFPKIDEVIVCSAPYKYIPVASTALKDYFTSAFNSVWSLDKKPLTDLKIFRGHSYLDEYGSMSYEQRTKAISSDNFYIDSSFIKDKTLFFIDDIRITGSHEERMISLLENADFRGTIFFLYYADLIGNTNPDIENELNYAFIKSISDIDFIIKNEEFIFNTRVTKYLLKYDSKEFEYFIKYQSNSFKHTLKTYAQGNDYHKQEPFKTNFETLNKYIN